MPLGTDNIPSIACSHVIVEVQQRGADGAAETLFLWVGRIAEPAQLPEQGGEGDAAAAVGVGRVQGQVLQPRGQAAGP